MRRISYLAAAAVLLTGTATLAPAAEVKDAKGLEFFEKHIRPVLVQHCYQCHSADAKSVKAGLLLDSRDGLLKGGESGAAIVPGKPGDSLLIEALKYDGLEMPPKEQLPEAVIAAFETWVKMGAPDPRQAKTSGKGVRTIDLAEGRKFWAFQAPQRHTAPKSKDNGWARTDVDRFIFAGLKQQNLAPIGDADRETLIRRLSFDLTGLPPSPEEIAAFAADKSPQALEKLVDRLLASEQFGERWGRHWLDVVRYGESSGKERNVPYPFAWRYRDYVIDSFNADKPFDQFLVEQVAGDLLPAKDEEERNRLQIATGFLAIGPKGLNEKNRDQYLMEIVDEQIDTTTRAFLATTVGCARCHDHKFDPIPTTDYYAMAGIFKSTSVMAGVGQGSRNSSETQLCSLATKPAEETKPVDEAKLKEAAEIEAELQKVRVTAKAEVIDEPRKLKKALNKGIQVVTRKESKEAKEKVAQLEAKLEKLGIKPKAAGVFAMAVEDVKKPADCRLCIRGEIKDQGDEVPRGFLSVLKAESDPAIPSDQSGRLQLAHWMAARSNPLTARVMVNRIWGHLFGAGLVESIDNFGSLGEKPSHPELLDNLAVQFMDEGWSVKRMVRSLVLTRAYALSSDHNASAYAADPQNKWRWRQNRRRLDAESIRDAILVTSGKLELQRPDGSPVMTAGTGEVGRGFNVGALERDLRCRSVYLPIMRGVVPEVLSVFDVADPSLVVGQREITTVATQALYMMNSPFVMNQAQATAERILGKSDLTAEQRVDMVYQLALGRKPASAERQRAVNFVADFQKQLAEEGSKEKAAEDQAKKHELSAWAGLCQTLMASGEFRYVY